jgi:hypothetical protein
MMILIPFLTIQEKNGGNDKKDGWQKSVNQILFWVTSGLIFAIFQLAMSNQSRFEKMIDTVSALCAKVSEIDGKNHEANLRQDQRIEAIRSDVVRIGDRLIIVERGDSYRGK